MRSKESLRIGIFTYHFSDNFGAGLQAYGLRTWLQSQGVFAEFVNYHPSHVESGGKFRFSVRKSALKGNLKTAFLWVMRLKKQVFGDDKQKELFSEFQRNTLGVKGPKLASREEVAGFLASPEGQFDMLICGSDQIWAPSAQFGIDPVYYLDFGQSTPEVKRVAYAPSFGRASLEDSVKQEATKYLSKFDALSGREKSGVALIERLSGKEVAWVPDPTILLGDFTQFVDRHGDTVSEDQIFCYALRTSVGIREAAELASSCYNVPISSPFNPHRRWREIGATIYPSPEQWVAHLAKSRCVVTNSFHGTVFSILFRKPFITVQLPGARAGLNERSRSLLSALGLEDRLVDGADADKVQKLLDAPIDWEAVAPKLIALQNAGRSYLMTQIGAGISALKP
jgi:hypothetical protein